MDEPTRDPQATKSPYETPRVVASLDALDLITDADGIGVGSRPWGSVSPSHHGGGWWWW